MTILILCLLSLLFVAPLVVVIWHFIQNRRRERQVMEYFEEQLRQGWRRMTPEERDKARECLRETLEGMQ